MRSRRCEPAATRPAPRPTNSFRAARRAWCFRDRRAKRRAIGRSALRSNWWPNGIPTRIRAGEDLPVRLTYENRPLAGALVVAMNRLNPSEKLSARTGQRRPRAIPAAAGRDVADQSRPHDSGAGRQPTPSGPVIGRRSRLSRERTRGVDACKHHLPRSLLRAHRPRSRA